MHVFSDADAVPNQLLQRQLGVHGRVHGGGDQQRIQVGLHDGRDKLLKLIILLISALF